jgi:PAS domain-containing protein
MCEEFDDGHRNAEPRRSSSVADAEMFVDKRRTSRRDPQHPTPPHRTDIKLGDAQPGDLAHLFQPDGQEREFIDVASIPDLDDRIGTPPNENHRNARTALDDDRVTDLDDDLNVRDGVAHVRDVTDKVRADDANRFQALLLFAVGPSVIASDADGVITFWNAAAETMQLVLAYRATHDALTQLPNSASPRESLEVVLA